MDEKEKGVFQKSLKNFPPFCIEWSEGGKKMDQENMEQRVWQRVLGTAEETSLQALAVAERNSGAAYLMLSRTAQGHAKTILRQLYERERQHERCLCGIGIARDGKALSIRTVPMDSQSPTVILRKCYAATLRALQEYERRRGDGQYGPVFDAMAQQEREHCRMILELLGTLHEPWQHHR